MKREETAAPQVPHLHVLFRLDHLADRGPVRHLHLEHGLRLGRLGLP